MKKQCIMAASLILLCSACGTKGGSSHDAAPPKLETFIDTLSWAYGQNLADLLQRGIYDSLDADLVLQAARHSLDGGQQPIPPEATVKALEFITIANNQIMAQQTQNRRQTIGEEQNAYLENLVKTNPSVKKHPSGFYYEVVKAGKGPNAKLAQRIKFDYRSKLMLTGQDYDQTYGKREPIIHVVGNPMFPGLIEAFQLMNAGSIYRFYFPYQLAFGERGSGGIPGYTPLIYEVELHEIYKN